MRVLVTGGAGYIGTSLCHSLLANPGIDAVTIYDNLSRRNYNLLIGHQKLDKRFRFVDGDILDSRRLRREIGASDVVYHLAARVSTPFADQEAHLFEQVNHWGTAEVGYAVEQSDVQKLVYLSSVSVYGSGADVKNVSTPRNPHSFYGISKMRGEDHMLRMRDKLDTYIFRCGNVYGYNKSMRFDAVINKFVFEANYQRRISIHGEGEQHRPFIHIDAAAAALAGVLRDSTRPGVYDLVEHNFAIRDIAGVLQTLYADLDIAFINQNIKLRELRVEPGDARDAAEAAELLRARLKVFRDAFAF